MPSVPGLIWLANMLFGAIELVLQNSQMCCCFVPAHDLCYCGQQLRPTAARLLTKADCQRNTCLYWFCELCDIFQVWCCVRAVFCHVSVQYLVSIAAQARHDITWHWVQAMRLACKRLRLTEVAQGLAALHPHAPAHQDLHSLLGLLCPPLCTAFFPR